MPDSFYFLARSVQGTALEDGCFYSFSELVDASNEEVADFLVAHNMAIKANYIPDGARRPKPAVKKEVPEEQKPVKVRRGKYTTRDMKAE